MDLKNQRVLLTGSSGFLGKAVYKELQDRGVKKIVTIPSAENNQVRTADLKNKEYCDLITRDCDVIIHLAANVGGIGKNKKHPYKLWAENTLMGVHIMEAARNERVKKLVVTGTVCEYPKITFVPFHESALWSGYPEETNAPYGIAKKSLLVGGQALRAEHNISAIHLLVVNLYGPNDHFDLEDSHVIPALIRKFAEAKDANAPFVVAWGTGYATREFLYVGDAARAIVMATENYDDEEPVNIGSSVEISIRDLTELIAAVIGYTGEIRWDTTKPDGQPRRKLDVSRAEKEFGFNSTTSFKEGLRITVDWYYKNIHDKPRTRTS